MTAQREPDEGELAKRFGGGSTTLGEGQPRRHPDRVKHGGIGESDADLGDVSRDTYSTPLGPAGTDGRGEAIDGPGASAGR